MIQHLAGVSRAFTPDAAAVDAVLAAVSAAPFAGQALSAQESSALEHPSISEDEVRCAIQRMCPAKSPGVDGLPLLVFSRGRRVLAPLLARVFTAALAEGCLPDGFLDGAVVSLFKPGAEQPTAPSSYRPITLLNLDYRILAKVLANRLRTCVARVVSPAQTAFVPGRRIGANVLTLQLLPEFLASQGRSAVVVFLDISKAFDTVCRSFLLRVLAAVGVGERFRGWVSLMLGDTRACSVLNGFRSRLVPFSEGVRQGCPMSPLLYLFVGEALLRFLTACGSVGVPLPDGGRLVATQFADDNQVCLEGVQCVPALLGALETFGRASNQRVNVSKSRLLPVGALAGVPLPPAVGGLPVVASARALGFVFPAGVGPAVPAAGWEALVAQAEGRLARLAGVPMSAFGRARAASAYAYGPLLYAAEFVALPAPHLRRLRGAAAALVDRGAAPAAAARRFAGVPADLLSGHPREGGFGLLPLADHLRARRAVWGVRLFSQGGAVHPWLALAGHHLRSVWPGWPAAWPVQPFAPARLAGLPGVVRGLVEAAMALPPPAFQLLDAAGGVGLGWLVPGSGRARVQPLTDLTVRVATALLRTRSAAVVSKLHKQLAFVMLAMGLQETPDAPPADPAMQRLVWARLGLLQTALRQLWRLPWGHCYKECFWRLVLDGLPTVQRLHVRGRCPCGHEGSDRPGRLHYFWQCEVAVALRRELATCLGVGVTPQQLLLMQPPPAAPSVRPAVWRVVCLAAVYALWDNRLLRCARPPPAAVAAVRVQAVVSHFWALLEDFVAMGAWLPCDEPSLGPAHPFLCSSGPGGRLAVRRPGAP
jgi:hypothetical protein